MAKYGRGLICLTLTRERCKQLNLPLMKTDTDSKHETNFTISIEASEGVTTGISAYDRAHTIRTAVMPDATSNDISRPGHIFPLRAKKGGVLRRAGHTVARTTCSTHPIWRTPTPQSRLPSGFPCCWASTAHPSPPCSRSGARC